MMITVWIAITDSGDGSHNAYLYPTEEHLRRGLQLDEDDFSPGYDVPVEIVSRMIETDMFMVEP